MSRTFHAIRTGIGRGWHEFVLSLKSPQDQGFYIFMALVTLGYLWLNRDTEVEGTELLLPSFAMPSILGALIAFGLVMGPGSALALEKEDGTLLRARAAPHGLTGYVTGQVVLHTMSLVPMFLVILVPSFFIFEGVMQNGREGWIAVGWVTVLGLLATLPIGIILGALVPSVQKLGTWGFFPIMGLVAISGIFFPIQNLWTWVQWVAQAFPIYWLGLGMRSAFLPAEAAAVEIGGSWRTTQTVLILLTWAIVGTLLAPPILRRMARRQSGSAVEAARAVAGQFVR